MEVRAVKEGMDNKAAISVRAAQARDFVVEEINVAAGTRLQRHGHNDPHLLFILSGELEERDRRGWHRMAQGSVRLSPSGDEHSIRFQTPVRCLLVLLTAQPTSSPIPVERVFHADPRLVPLSAAVARFAGPREQECPFSLELSVLELLAAAIPGRSSAAAVTPRWLQEIRERIRDAPSDPPSTVQLARDAGYHPVYVARCFRAHYGIGLGEYARLARAEYAYGLLATTTESLARVAAQAGYADQAHLTRSLVKRVGRTPARIRRREPLVEVSSVQDPVAAAK